MDDSNLHAHMDIHFLKNYLDHLENDVSKEIYEIEQKIEKGHYESTSDLEGAYDYPLFRLKFGTRSIYYELNSIVEAQLHKKAEPHFAEIKQDKKWKNKISVSEIPIWAVLKVIQTNYGPLTENIAGWDEFERLRKMVNSFKHSKGARKAEDISLTETGGYEFIWESSFNEAKQFIELIPNIIDRLSKLKVKNV